MRSIFSICLVLFIANFSFAQPHSIVGAWYHADETQNSSLFLKADGTVSFYSGKKEVPMMQENMIHGTYRLSKGKLQLSFKDKSTRLYRYQFKDKFTLVLSPIGQQPKATPAHFVYKRVVDEEVVSN